LELKKGRNIGFSLKTLRENTRELRKLRGVERNIHHHTFKHINNKEK
jgi:hypothetical protein